jgi:hypothetical protein
LSAVTKEIMACVCGYSSLKPATVRRHQGTCKAHLLSLHQDGEKTQMRSEIEHLRHQLAEKDHQIQDLIRANKKPRTVNHNNRYVVEQHINVFGKETLGHITPEQIQRLLADPENAVAKFVKLKHRDPRNANIRCPNMNRAIYQVVVQEGEGKEWENRARGEVLEMLYDDGSCVLEGEAVEEDHTPFLDYQDRVKASMDGVDGGKCYKHQLDKIHHMIIN